MALGVLDRRRPRHRHRDLAVARPAPGRRQPAPGGGLQPRPRGRTSARPGPVLAVALAAGALQVGTHELVFTCAWKTVVAVVGLVGVVVVAPRLLPTGTFVMRHGSRASSSRGRCSAPPSTAASPNVPLFLAGQRGASLQVAGLALAVGAVGWALARALPGHDALHLPRHRLIEVVGSCSPSGSAGSRSSRGSTCRRGSRLRAAARRLRDGHRRHDDDHPRARAQPGRGARRDSSSIQLSDVLAACSASPGDRRLRRGARPREDNALFGAIFLGLAVVAAVVYPTGQRIRTWTAGAAEPRPPVRAQHAHARPGREEAQRERGEGTTRAHALDVAPPHAVADEAGGGAPLADGRTDLDETTAGGLGEGVGRQLAGGLPSGARRGDGRPRGERTLGGSGKVASRPAARCGRSPPRAGRRRRTSRARRARRSAGRARRPRRGCRCPGAPRPTPRGRHRRPAAASRPARRARAPGRRSARGRRAPRRRRGGARRSPATPPEGHGLADVPGERLARRGLEPARAGGREVVEDERPVSATA